VRTGKPTRQSSWQADCEKAAMLSNGDEFKSFTELRDKVSEFERAECVQLYNY